MTKVNRKRKEALAKIEIGKKYALEEAVEFARSIKSAKFDETVEIAVNLGVDPTKADQMVRGSVVLPGGTGRKSRILVFAKGEKEMEAKEAGADHVGAEDMAEKIKGGWLEFDVAVSTPDMMGLVGKLGKILGPRGLMPNPKSGTVTFDVKRAIDEIRKGRVEFRVDKGGVVHASIGKASFDQDKLLKNARAFLETVIRLKPSAAKGTYIKGITLSTTMGPGLRVDEAVASLSLS